MQGGGTQDTSDSIPSCCTALVGSWFIISDYVIKLGGSRTLLTGDCNSGWICKDHGESLCGNLSNILTFLICILATKLLHVLIR